MGHRFVIALFLVVACLPAAGEQARESLTPSPCDGYSELGSTAPIPIHCVTVDDPDPVGQTTGENESVWEFLSDVLLWLFGNGLIPLVLG